MQPLVTQNTLINGRRITYGIFGTGEPVVLLHGTPFSSLIWRNVVPNLADAGLQVFVFDLLGYGLSERPWDPAVDTSVTAQVGILEGLLTHWNIDKFDLVGHDIGGAIAQRFAVFSPGRLRSLTLIDTVSFDSWPSKRTIEQMEAGLESLAKKPEAEHRDHFRTWLLTAAHDKDGLTRTSLPTFLDYISGPIGQASLFEHQVKYYAPKHTAEVAERLHELRSIPVKIVWGANDAWQVVQWAHKLHQAIPGSSLDILEDAGHVCMEDRPDAVSKLILDQVKDLPSSKA